MVEVIRRRSRSQEEDFQCSLAIWKTFRGRWNEREKTGRVGEERKGVIGMQIGKAQATAARNRRREIRQRGENFERRGVKTVSSSERFLFTRGSVDDMKKNSTSLDMTEESLAETDP
eukprot:760539-Hanusia_phi.AAC.2